MTKQELIQKIAAKSGLTKKDAESVLNTVLDEISQALKSGKKYS